ncbi:ABC transporter permease [Adhaeribacter pallidiroseus]|uniref:Putative ABC transporter permease YvrN n=1 Tax=Adhaeribacter pallidiroseus TaxID=2072847 RepID=A0A369QKW3_9BACT|nr:ABC transporter permease [Adhaeribacter pallidiroseus]RDC65531.1 putative ABC transporter permease YvrN [Adhaeribacter pallidiroseus]
MFRHSLLLIYRNFLRFKSTFFINLIGLSSGLACALAIYLWVYDELHFDKFHAKDEQLFRVMENWQEPGGITTKPTTPHQLAAALVAEMPEVEYATTVTPPAFFPKFTLAYNNHNIRATGKFVGKDFFKIFSFPLTQGDKNQVLTDRNSLVISESMAQRLFGTTRNVIGKAVEWETMGIQKPVHVSGIFKDVPANSSEEFDFVLAFEAFEKDVMNMGVDWDMPEPFYTYLTLKPDADVKQFNQKIAGYLQSKSSKAQHRTLFLEPYSSNYLYGKYENGVSVGTRLEYVKLFSLIALFILVMACINFMNLSTAKASRRLKEVGIKKTFGASRQLLIWQYLGEALLLTSLSLLLAIGLVVLFLPQFNQITGKQLTLHFDVTLILTVLGISVLTGIIAGSYPALYLSGFNPVAILKGKFNRSGGEVWARKGLVVFQFALSIVFMVAVLVVYQQIQYVQNKNLGYDKDQLITFEVEGKITPTDVATFLTELKKIPGVVNASSKLDKFIGGFSGPNGIKSNLVTIEDKQIPMNEIRINYDMIETLGIPVVAGRTFSKEFGTDTKKKVVNQAFVNALGLKEPVGKIVKEQNGLEFEIIGVVKDFHYESLHEKVVPLLFTLEPETATVVLAKLAAGQEQETISQIQQFYREFNPGFVFDFQFLDEDYQAQYVAEQRVAALSRYFAGLAILISCLGLFGLAAFTAERRRKEIGVRKVLGASAFSIVYLLSGEFTKLVVTAIVIALPVSYLIVKHWLNSFAYQITLEPWYFIGAGLLALVVAWLTVGLQAVKAAKINPVHCLRDE